MIDEGLLPELLGIADVVTNELTFLAFAIVILVVLNVS